MFLIVPLHANRRLSTSMIVGGRVRSKGLQGAGEFTPEVARVDRVGYSRYS